MADVMVKLGDVEYPGKYEVCGNCRGKGSHVNRAIDGNGISREEMDELGPEFFEDYMNGVYDVPCDECRGARVVAVLDEGLASPEQVAEYYEYLQEEADYRAECEQERRMGC